MFLVLRKYFKFVDGNTKLQIYLLKISTFGTFKERKKEKLTCIAWSGPKPKQVDAAFNKATVFNGSGRNLLSAFSSIAEIIRGKEDSVTLK